MTAGLDFLPSLSLSVFYIIPNALAARSIFSFCRRRRSVACFPRAVCVSQNATSSQGTTTLLHIAALNNVDGFKVAQWLLSHGLHRRTCSEVDEIFVMTPLALACAADDGRPPQRIDIPLVRWMLTELGADIDFEFDGVVSEA